MAATNPSPNGRAVAPMLVPLAATIEGTLPHMQHEAALMVDDAGRLRGVVTDGDLRRAFLAGASLSTPVAAIMTRQPIALPVGATADQALALMIARQIRHLPAVDEEGRPTALFLLKDCLGERDEADAVIMAGGLGTRLRPLTIDTPKPLLRVGDRPILDTILDSLKRRGVDEVVIAVNYLREQIKSHVGDGGDYGMHVRYVEEERQLGTAGALALIEPRPERAFLLMNGDLFTELDYRSFIRFHRDSGNDLSVCVRRFATTIPYGVVSLEPGTHTVASIVEKPEQHCLVNAGIYMLEPRVIDLVPAGQPFDMVSLMHAAMAAGWRVGAFPLLEYWCDIGRHQDMAAARDHWRVRAARDANVGAALPLAPAM